MVSKLNRVIDELFSILVTNDIHIGWSVKRRIYSAAGDNHLHEEFGRLDS